MSAHQYHPNPLNAAIYECQRCGKFALPESNVVDDCVTSQVQRDARVEEDIEILTRVYRHGWIPDPYDGHADCAWEEIRAQLPKPVQIVVSTPAGMSNKFYELLNPPYKIDASLWENLDISLAPGKINYIDKGPTPEPKKTWLDIFKHHLQRLVFWR